MWRVTLPSDGRTTPGYLGMVERAHSGLAGGGSVVAFLDREERDKRRAEEDRESSCAGVIEDLCSALGAACAEGEGDASLCGDHLGAVCAPLPRGAFSSGTCAADVGALCAKQSKVCSRGAPPGICAALAAACSRGGWAR